MIDVHIHGVPPSLPGVGSLSPLLDMSTEAIASVLQEQMQAAGVTQVLAMGCWNISAEDPLGIAGTLRLGGHVPGLHAIGIADPTRTDAEHLRRVDAALATAKVRALKGYLGYLHFGPNAPQYVPYYQLAARYGIPFIFHTCDT